MLVCLLGAGLRLWRLGAPAADPLAGLPPGLYHDEAYNGLDILDVLDGRPALYFPANNGREPLFIYLQALFVAVLGRSAFALRLPAAFVGVLLIPAAYALGWRLFGRRAGLLAAAVLAFSFWPVSISRVGLRAPSLALVSALALSAAWSGLRRGRKRTAALGGALYGLSFYTYLAARLTPLALILFAGWLWLTGRARTPRHWRRPLLTFGLAAGVTLLPLGAYAARWPGTFFERSSELSIVGQPDFPRALGENALRTLGMFWVTGDEFSRPRHNLPGRPFFDPLLGAAMLLGLAAAWRTRARRPALALTLIWVGVLLLPTVLSVEAPYFLRTVGILPWVAFLPALGLEAAGAWLSQGPSTGLPRAWPRGLGQAAVVGVLVLSLLLTARDYFLVYARDPQLPYSFETAAQALADEALAAPGPVWVDNRYWSFYKSIEFLLRGRAQVTVFEEGVPLSPQSGSTAAVFIWPYVDPRPSLGALPLGGLIGARPGALFKNDLEPEAYVFYSVYTSGPPPEGPPLARFENGMALHTAEVRPAPGGVELFLVWSAGPRPQGDLHVFAQALEAEQVVGQADGVPAHDLYPTSWWRPGDYVADPRLIQTSPTTQTKYRVGLYNPISGERLRLVSGADRVEFHP